MTRSRGDARPVQTLARHRRSRSPTCRSSSRSDRRRRELVPQGLDGVQARGDALDVAERADEPGAQAASAHRGLRGVEHAHERAVAAAVLHGRHQLEVALGGRVERDVVVGAVALDAADVRECAPSASRRGSRAPRRPPTKPGRQVVHAVALQAVRLEVAEEGLGREVVPEDPILLGFVTANGSGPALDRRHRFLAEPPALAACRRGPRLARRSGGATRGGRPRLR